MADETATTPTTAPDTLTAEDFHQVQAVLGGRGYQMVSFEMDGLFARFDTVRTHGPRSARATERR